MSFYGSEPTPNISTNQQPSPHQRLSANANAWSGTPLDQLVFQENDNPLNHMGGLRRSSPQPQSNDPNFSIVDPATAELAPYPTDPVANDRFLLDSARLDFDAAIQRRPTSNHVDHRDKPHRSQPTPTYRQPWERPPTGISASAASPLSPDAFEIADELGINTSGPPESFEARSKHARPLGLGKYVQRLIDFNKEQQRGMQEGSLERDWKPLIAAYFTPDATLQIDLKSNSSAIARTVKLPVESLPRLWKSKVDAGMTGERMLLEDPCEFQYPNGVVTVDCPRTVIITTYQNKIVHTDGNLRVSFHRNKKIAEWLFCSQKHEEVFTRQGISAGANFQQSLDFGFPTSVIRLLMIANDVYRLRDRISDEISTLLSDPRRMRGMQSLMNAAVAKQEAVLPNFQDAQPGQNGNAFKTLRSVLNAGQLDQGLTTSLGMPLGRGGTGPGGRGLPGDLEVDIKAELENESNVVPNLKDAFNWSSEPQPSAMFPHIFDETMRSSFMQGNASNFPNSAGQGHGDLNLNPRKGAPSIGDARASQSRQSAIDAVAAVASGQGGWGIVAPGGSGMGTSTGGGEDFDRSLQLLNAATDGNFAARHDSGTAQRGNAQGQNAPPGLDVFTPQSSEAGRGSESQGRRARGGSRGRSAAGGQTRKEIEKFRALQRRVSASKAKREATGESGHSGGGAANHGDFVGTSQGLTHQNRSVGNVKNSSRAENAKTTKERGHGSAGNRRPAQRNSSTDERLEKRQKTTAQNGEQR